MVAGKQSLKTVLPIGAKPVDKSGQSGQRPTTTLVEDIWSPQYCQKHPENAANAIKTLQDMLTDRDSKITALEVAIRNIREVLDERI